MQTIYYLREEITDTCKMKVCFDPLLKDPLERELVAVMEQQKLKLKQSYSRAPRGGGGEGALKPPHRTWGRTEEMGNLRRMGRRENERKRR